VISPKNLANHYRAIRARLRYPPNAVPDMGINLKRPKKTEPCIEEVAPKPTTAAVTYYPLNYVPFKRKDLTFSSTLDFTAKEFGITPKEIRTHTRVQNIALPRQIAVWIAHKNKLQSLSGMGHYLNMDHTTMLHARDKIIGLIEKDDTLKQRILSLEEKLIAAYPRTPVSDLSEPHLDTQETEGNEAVGSLPTVDSGG
jgi:hypothetical protein